MKSRLVPAKGDVCVVGAGPGGCVVATRLAELGFAVFLVEGQAFPRPHVGICLSEESEPLFQALGILSEYLSAGFHERRCTWVQWADSGFDSPQRGLHVDRGVLDSILLQKAIERGVQVLQPVKVRQANRNPNGGWNLEFDPYGAIECQFLVDASGRNSALRPPQKRSAQPLLAIHASWELGDTPSHDGWIEAGDQAWYWLAQTGPDRALVSVFVDPRSLADTKAHNLSETYLRLLEGSDLRRRYPLDIPLGPPKACDASSRHCSDPVGEDFVCVGDSAMSVDPLASQGVHLAMSGALLAAAVVNTALRYPGDRTAALAFYRQRHEEKVERFRTKTAEMYGEVALVRSTSFWEDRIASTPTGGQPSYRPPPSRIEPITLSPRAELRPTPLLDGDRIVTGPALHHPGLDRPVAWVAGIRIAEFLPHASAGLRPANLIQAWDRLMPPGLAGETLTWLWASGVLTQAE